MVSRIEHTSAGAVESVNADYVCNWDVEIGHVHLVIDGIGHTEETLWAIEAFVAFLRGKPWRPNECLEKQVKNNVSSALSSLPAQHTGKCFCIALCLIVEDSVIVAHCGDCRVGILKDEGLT